MRAKYRPVGGYKCRSWRLRKKYDKWLSTIIIRALHRTLDKMQKDGNKLIYAYQTYDVISPFWRNPYDNN